MKVIHFSLLVCSLAIVTATGCGTAADSAMTTNENTNAADVDASQYQLADEPDDAIGVIVARESAEDGAPLVLVGRIGGTASPWIDGRAAFTLLDASMSVVAKGEDSGENEMCLGDCCAADRKNCTTLVKVVDEQGKLVPVDSRELLGLKEADMVVVKGTAQKDEAGNFVMLARGVFIRN